MPWERLQTEIDVSMSVRQWQYPNLGSVPFQAISRDSCGIQLYHCSLYLEEVQNHWDIEELSLQYTIKLLSIPWNQSLVGCICVLDNEKSSGWMSSLFSLQDSKSI
jgi:hypothetical protein